MVLVAALRDYVLRMLTDVPGVKVLIVDEETVGMVSLALSQSEILHKDVFLVEKLESRSQELMTHLKAVCFVRPTAENVQRLKKHLAAPRFSQYHIFFSNILSSPLLHILADADEHEAVAQLQEFFGDYYPLDPFHFTIPTKHNHFCYVSATVDLPNTQRICERSKEALLAVFLSLKKRPCIRYQRGSEMARRLAHEVGRVMYEAEKPLFDFRRSDSVPLLLVLDRRDDPITPLLNQWTYQAMVHELLGISDNRVDLRNVAGIGEDQKELVLSAEQDEFFRRNMFENFGDVGVAISKAVDDLQKKDKRRQGLKTLDDMAQLLESYPEYRRQAGNVAKHVALMSELQKRVEARKLMAVSQEEQELAASPSHTQAAAYEAVLEQVNSDAVTYVDKLRLVMLYALRFEKESPRHFAQLMNKLSSAPVGSASGASRTHIKPALVHTLLGVFGSASRARVGDLYGSKDLLNVVARNVKRGLTGVENVYTQHQPLLMQTIDAAMKSRLSEGDYPFYGAPQAGKAQDVVVFVVGGTTYEEARSVALFNAANPGLRVLLGGTTLLNSSRFLQDLAELNTLESTSGLE